MNNIADSLNSINIQQTGFSDKAAVPPVSGLQSTAGNLAKVKSDTANGVYVPANGVQNTGNVQSAVKSTAAPAAEANKNLQTVLKTEIKQSFNPVPALSTLTLFKWDPKAGGTVIDIVNSKTGKVESQIPSEEFIKYMMSHYQKGALLNEKL
jgi:uncharacterized FlaG/YvyC family protein